MNARNATAEAIAQHRKDFAALTDEELLAITRQDASNPPKALAAKQELEARRERAEEERHEKIEARLDELKRPHWTVLPNFWVTVLAAVAAIVAAYFAWRPQPAAVEPPLSVAPAAPASSLQKPQPLPASPKP